MRIVVTGGAGFIGSHVCEALAKRGDDVSCFDNFSDYYVQLAGSRFAERKQRNIQEVQAALAKEGKSIVVKHVDFTIPDSVYGAFNAFGDDVDAVIHLGALAGVRTQYTREDYFKTNHKGTHTVLEAAWWTTNTKRFVIASSSSVYGTNEKVPFSEDDGISVSRMKAPYAESKHKVEEMCQEYCVHNPGASIALLRFFTVYGPRGRPDMAPYKFVDALHQGKPISRFGDGDKTARDYTYIEDIVAGILAALDTMPNLQPCEIFNLGNSSPVTLNQFIKTVEDVTGKKAVINDEPANQADVPITYADVSKAERLLRWKPTTNIKEGLKKFYDWYLKSPESSS